MATVTMLMVTTVMVTMVMAALSKKSWHLGGNTEACHCLVHVAGWLKIRRGVGKMS